MRIKSKKRVRYFAIFMILNILFEIASPTVALALTNGPMQPEFVGFEPANSNEMVDLFTGDFKYNIPLMDVDGYPLNLSYHAGQSVDAEASWVGLGWALNPGVLNRNVKGLPDDFNGDIVTSETHMKPMTSVANGKQYSEWLGMDITCGILNLGFTYGVQNSFNLATVLTYDNYKGYGFHYDHDSHNSESVRTLFTTNTKVEGYGISHSSQEGGSFRDSYGNGVAYGISTPWASAGLSKYNGASTNYNTRNGKITTTYMNSGSLGGGGGNSSFSGGGGIGRSSASSIPSGAISYLPKIPFSYLGGGQSKSKKYGFWGKVSAGYPGISVGIAAGKFRGVKTMVHSMEIDKNDLDKKSYGFLYSENAGEQDLMDFNRGRDGAILAETPNASYATTTYDLFYAQAQGLSTAFRPFRSDIGFVRDPKTIVSAMSTYTGSELGGVFSQHKLDEQSNTFLIGNCDIWQTPLLSNFQFQKYDNLVLPFTGTFFEFFTPKHFIEKTYFKQFGELTERDEAYENGIDGDALVAPRLVKVGAAFNAFSPVAGATRRKRDKRSTYIESLTAIEAHRYGYEKKYNLYDKNTFSIDPNTRLLNVSSDNNLKGIDRRYKLHGGVTTIVNDHLSEISVTSKHGDRYVYGIPSYNLTKKNVMFNVSNRVEGNYQTYSGTNTWPNVQTYVNIPLLKSNESQLVQYTGAEASSSNKRGLDNFFQIETVPRHATSFLLTSILSSDYVDVTGNGPTYDDLGSFTKFNYLKTADYQWREPYCVDPTDFPSKAGGMNSAINQANLSTGLISDELDDRAFFQTGTRENYYTHSIETKNYVAVFSTSDRYDAMGVTSPNGSKGGSAEVLRLDSVKLYSKSEIIRAGNVKDAEPVKCVYFEYDYSLCPGTFNTLNTLAAENPTRGKLTLKKLYFTSGKSRKAALSPYEFKYADNDHSSTNGSENNYEYDSQSQDRWGSYKPNSGTATGSSSSSDLNNVEFPYSEQNKALADQYAAAWNLSEIVTPTGASIKITYEADDYAFVQSEPASQMLHIFNAVGSCSYNDNVSLLHTAPAIDLMDKLNLIIDLSRLSIGIPTTLSETEARAVLWDNLLLRGTTMYCKSFLKVAEPKCGAGIDKNYYDYVSDYVGAANQGVFTDSHSGNTYVAQAEIGGSPVTCYKYAFIELFEEHAYESKKVNPICVSGWEFLRNYLPRLAYPGSEPSNVGNPNKSPKELEDLLNAAIGVSIIDHENGLKLNANKRFVDKGFCNELIPQKSFIRTGARLRKIGGGHRVKSITSEDNWGLMTTSINSTSYQESNTIYGQKFEYTTTVSGTKISSGVASYEPLVGGDENTLRNQIKYTVEKSFAPNDNFFQDNPLGEELYPSPVVGYSNVKIIPIADPNATDVCENGHSEYSFYTAKDFPLKAESSQIQKATIEKTPTLATLSKFIKKFDHPSNTSFKYFHTAQGNVLKFNDMHGKLRSVSHFGAKDQMNPITKTEYIYKATGNGQTGFELVTSVPTINEENVISTHTISRDIDVTVDARENISETIIRGTSDVIDVGVVVSVVPYAPYVQYFPDVSVQFGEKFASNSKFGYRGASITKIVQQYGILDRVETTHDGIMTSVENLLWDANTGNVLLTKTTDPYNESVYNFSYPAYWGYSEMDSEFKRDGISMFCPSSPGGLPIVTPWDPTSGILDLDGLHDPIVFSNGDEVMVMDLTQPGQIGSRFWIIHDPANTAPNTYCLVDQNGLILNTTNNSTLDAGHDYQIKLVRPINRNKLDYSMGQVVSKTNPINSNFIDFNQTNQKIISASAQKYCSGGSVFINEDLTNQIETNVGEDYLHSIFNPITSGTYGDFKPTATYNYLVPRTYGNLPDAKTDGFFANFTPFWEHVTNAIKWNVAVEYSMCGSVPTNSGNWKKTGENVIYSPYGQLLQTRNAIDVNSAQRFGFNHTLPILSASNAKVDEVGYDGFEDYTTLYPTYDLLSTASSFTANIVNNDYLGFYMQSSEVTPSTKPSFSDAESHTGRFSMLFGVNQSVSLKHNVFNIYERPKVLYEDGNICECRHLHDYLNATCLNFQYEQPYLISMWVKGTTPSTDYSSLPTLSTTHSYTYGATPVNVTNTYTPTTSGVINGWQKLDYEIAVTTPIPAQAPNSNLNKIFIKIEAGSGSFYLDDFRIQPFNSVMTTKVYDPYHLRLCAELDAQNFATIYEYDNSGTLVRTKKETNKTIYTVQESRQGTNKR